MCELLTLQFTMLGQRKKTHVCQGSMKGLLCQCRCVGWTVIVILTGLTTMQVSGLSDLNNLVEDYSHDEGNRFRDEVAATELLKELDREVAAQCQNRAMKEWLYASNITAENRVAAAESAVSYSKFWKGAYERTRYYDWRSFKNPAVKRQFKFLSTLGISILPEEQLRKYNSLKQSMESIYATAKVCNFSDPTDCTWAIEPELTEMFINSRDPELLKYIWVQWRDLTGKKMRSNYTDMVDIINIAANMNNFSNAMEYDIKAYESTTFRQDIERLWQQLKPFYEQLHAYVRFKLREYYENDTLVPRGGPIPAHLLGNMWAQTWTNIFDIVIPFENKTSIDVTKKMVQLGLTPYNMTKLAEEFFVSLNLSAMPEEFWKGSILEKPKGREMICHASAWDMCNRKDFWIKQCTRINMEDLITLHHEMGHIQYQIQYKNLPKLFRDGANPGFHEAIGDLMALSVQTPQHLFKIGLLDTIENDTEADLNYLMTMALEKIAFLPFGYLMDLWRWDLYEKTVSPDGYNCHWWKLREKYQGLSAPVPRSEDDFDPGSKYHVASNVAYIRYFVSTIVQFQFHEALCITAGQFNASRPDDPEKPLYKCDIFHSTEAGAKLAEMLRMGSSKPWPEAMQIVTGQRAMNAQPILSYFHPLMVWLEEQNKKNNESIGWKIGHPSCKPGRSSSGSSTLSSSFFNLVVACVLVLLLALSYPNDNDKT